LIKRVNKVVKDSPKPPSAEHGIVILIDPPSYHYHENLFFDLETPLNRDKTLNPNSELRDILQSSGYPVFTADLYDKIYDYYKGCLFHYWSFGATSLRALKFNGKGVKKIGAVLFEPPLVKPNDYLYIERLAQTFEYVFLHNTTGDGFSIPDPALAQKLKKFYWTNKDYESAGKLGGEPKRLSKIALIAGAHFSKAKTDNGYGKRLVAIKKVGFKGFLDLYGFGWRAIQFRAPLLSIYWYLKFYLVGLTVTQPEKKSDVYKRYDFSLCFENMAMSGYVTEKIFDSFFAGCIPIYWGAPDINDYVPENCFISLNNFATIEACAKYCLDLTEEEKETYRSAIDHFLESPEFKKFSAGIHGFVSDFYKSDSKAG